MAVGRKILHDILVNSTFKLSIVCVDKRKWNVVFFFLLMMQKGKNNLFPI